MGPILRRLVRRGQLEASVVFGPVLESSRLTLTIPWALHGSWENGARVCT
jgi:hypothetical protein